MSGQKQFDEEAALEAAMLAFWQNGFDGTSLKELESVTGLNKSSLYNAYGNKEMLYLTCLERFSQRHGGDLLRLLDEGDFRTSVRSFFDALIARQRNEAVPPGCMATMAALENGGALDTEGSIAPVQEAVEAGLETMNATFKARCDKAVETGELPVGTDTQALASMLLAMSRGIAVIGRGHSDIQMARQAVVGMLALI